MSNLFTPGPTPNTVRFADGKVLTARLGAAFTRRCCRELVGDCPLKKALAGKS